MLKAIPFLLAAIVASGCMSNPDAAAPAIDPAPGAPAAPLVGTWECNGNVDVILPSGSMWPCAVDEFTHADSTTGYVIEARWTSEGSSSKTWVLEVGTVERVEPDGFQFVDGLDMDEVVRVRGESPLRLVLEGSQIKAGVHYEIWLKPDPGTAAVVTPANMERLSGYRATFDGIALDREFRVE